VYAVIDIETNGGGQNTGKVTEIAILIFDGQQVIDSFDTLINPESPIPYAITRLTGIDNKMTSNAPKFYEVARKIVEMTSGRTFVAHNVNFDYGFIQKEFRELGYDYRCKTLCTVKLSRKYIPGLDSYSLGNVCNKLGININNRHRAGGDAMATVLLLKELLIRSGTKLPSLFA
jgi:DNA polymerase III subunit epsilon